MVLSELLSLYAAHPQVASLEKWSNTTSRLVHLEGLTGSSRALVAAALYFKHPHHYLIIMDDAEEAGYFYHDLTQLLTNEFVHFFPSSYKNGLKHGQIDSANEILRTEVLNFASQKKTGIIVTYPDALMEKVVETATLDQSTLTLHAGEKINGDFLTEVLTNYGFSPVDFVYEPGQYSVRGGIVDIFSFSHEFPFRIDFFGNEIDSIRTFDITTQLSKENKTEVSIIADLRQDNAGKKIALMEFIDKDTLLFFNNFRFVRSRMNDLYDDILTHANAGKETIPNLYDELLTGDLLEEQVASFRIVEMSAGNAFPEAEAIPFHTSAQPFFHKNFDLISQHFLQSLHDGYQLFILSDSKKQTDRISAIFQDREENIAFTPVLNTLHEGFADHDLMICCYTDHQIFDRYHKYSLRSDSARAGKVVMTLKELNQLNQGDYIVHVDHGIGRFAGLFTMDVNGKKQEVIKLLYKNDDIVIVSIHSLHRIAKYKGKEGEEPKISKLGTGAWEALKERTKKKVKDIARELIQLYARRRSEQGFSYTPDSYLQHELEASFLYEDTPDQSKATADVKQDMESSLPMDRLVCGDVGFGKTEVAIRAAFKAATDGKQTAVLVPTTILAFQHYQTFSERLKEFPCTVDYLSRARSAAETKEIVEKLRNGKIDIIIGTHKLIGKNVVFKDLGLLVIDEEQKFGVSVKEKLRQLKASVDTLTLTATPIPRTLQFSLMGARDLSVINTPPPNRYPVHTSLHEFNEDIIREAIMFEMERNGQIFFVNNRIHTIYEIQHLIRKLVPEARVAVGHGQMDPEKLEEVILDFVNYEYDVLIATSIIESGIDMPNVNTIIINSAHHFGLSDLHQLRGRVGRTNRKAFCYLITPPQSQITPEARRRLQAIENFSDLGSGFNIAMMDLDIRGAGNMLGAEQSGFIAELGYETYQKILNEAVQELKNEEFANLYREVEQERMQHNAPVEFVTDCQIETDFEMMFPAQYIESVAERISLYRELDGITNERDLTVFEQHLADRFGKIPQEGLDLIQVVRLRWLAKAYGIERLVLKNEKWIAYLVGNTQSPYYQSDIFGKILAYMAQNPRRCQLKEHNSKRSVVIEPVRTIHEAYSVMEAIDKM